MRLLSLLLLAAGAWAAQAPSIAPLAPVQILEDPATTRIVLAGIAPGTPGASVTVGASVGDTALLLAPTVIYTSPAAAGEVWIQPRPDAFGSTVLTVTVRDSAGGTTAATAAVTVLSVNDPPAFTLAEAWTFDEDTAASACKVTLTEISRLPTNESNHLSFLVGVADPALVQFDSVFHLDSGLSAFIYFRPQPDRFGSTQVAVTVIDDDGTANGGRNATTHLTTITIAPINDPPVLTANRALAVGIGGTVAVGIADLALSDADQVADSTLVWTLETPPAAGDWLLDGAALVAGGGFTQADLAAGRISYRHRGGPAAGDALGLRFSDGVVALPLGPVQVAIVVAGRARPLVALLAATVPSWREGDAPTLIAPAALVEDGDRPDLGGGSLSVWLAADSHADDRLAILSQGTGGGQIALDGDQVLHGGRAIGRWSGGTPAAPLRVALAGADATPAAVQALLRRVAFSNGGDDPGDTLRSIAVVVDDGDAGASLPVAAALAVVPVNDPPRLLTRAIATPPGLARRFVLQGSDPDTFDLGMVFSIASQPANATVTKTGPPWKGECTIVPKHAGTEKFTVSLADRDGQTISMLVALTVTGPSTPRPHPRIDPPLTAEVGSTFIWELDCDTTDLGPGAELDFDLTDDAPNQAFAWPTGPATATIYWDIPATARDGSYQRLTVIASDRGGQGATIIPLTLRLVAPPKASQ
ncbi:MAG: hypothetical protein L6R48_24835 [Planctomycetes bacterium]|nr:hypothetical protein [Planctomycetota bacterium]